MKNEIFEDLIKLTHKYSGIIIISFILITLVFIGIFWGSYKIQDYYNWWPNYYSKNIPYNYNRDQAKLMADLMALFRAILFLSWLIIFSIIWYKLENEFQDKFKNTLVFLAIKNIRSNDIWNIQYVRDIKSYDKSYYEKLNNVVNLAISYVLKIVNKDVIEKYINKKGFHETKRLEDLIIINSIFNIIDFSFGCSYKRSSGRITDVGSIDFIDIPVFTGFILDFSLNILKINRNEIVKEGDFEVACYFDNKLNKMYISYILGAQGIINSIKPYLDYLEKKYYYDKKFYNSFFVIKYDRVWNFISFKDLNYNEYKELFPVPSIPTFINKDKIEKIYEIYYQQIDKLINFLTS
jgi:hypothetical protein